MGSSVSLDMKRRSQHRYRKKGKTPWPESASQLHRSSDSRLSAKLVPTSEDRGCLRPHSQISRPEPLLFLPSSSSVVLHETEWTPFPTHYFSENSVAPGNEPRPLDLQPGTLTTRPQRRAFLLLDVPNFALTGLAINLCRPKVPLPTFCETSFITHSSYLHFGLVVGRFPLKLPFWTVSSSILCVHAQLYL
jgi:hypothetical protein